MQIIFNTVARVLSLPVGAFVYKSGQAGIRYVPCLPKATIARKDAFTSNGGVHHGDLSESVPTTPECVWVSL